MSLIAEPKHRKVFKVGAAYLVVASLAVQAAPIGFPAFYFGFDKFVLSPRREAAGVARTTEAAKAETVVVAGTASAPAIVVMPFENLSPDPDNAFFAGGVFEEVLTKLSKVPELQVISRTSTEQHLQSNLGYRPIRNQAAHDRRWPGRPESASQP